jgi:hypothetical protein
MRTEPIFVKESDYNNYTGRNLKNILDPNSEIQNACNLFLLQIENRIMAKVDNMSFRVRSWDNLTPLQKEKMQLAIIEQAEYTLRNGDLFTDSGYDVEKGEIISTEKLRKIEICSIALEYLQSCGLLNKNIKNRVRYNDLF